MAGRRSRQGVLGMWETETGWIGCVEVVQWAEIWSGCKGITSSAFPRIVRCDVLPDFSALTGDCTLTRDDC